jgi:hypothetical protein
MPICWQLIVTDGHAAVAALTVSLALDLHRGFVLAAHAACHVEDALPNIANSLCHAQSDGCCY